MAEAAIRREPFHGHPSIVLTLPAGDSLRVMLHGAHVVSWMAAGRERLYLSPRSRFDGVAAIRGGVPICFPQFNQRGPLPRHGFARNLAWELEGGAEFTAAGPARLALVLRDGPATRVHWAQAFEARLQLWLSPGQLQLTLTVRNMDTVPLEFSGALHTYLAVDDIAAARLEGLEGRSQWDALADHHGRAAPVLAFEGEFDRVYAAPAHPMRLRDVRGEMLIEQGGWEHTVVWNPGARGAAALSDLPADGYRHMLCVEAAQVMRPAAVAAGASWASWQRLRVA